MSNWFNTLGWWDQKEAYAAFDRYRSNPTQETFDEAVTKGIPIIRVVISTQKFKLAYGGDEEDLVSHAALTITKALPKMIKKDKIKLDDDKKYMRYLFTCVVNAFYREYDILHGKHNKLQRKINGNLHKAVPRATIESINQLEANMTINSLPTWLYTLSLSMVRFENNDKNICSYIIQQIMSGREISKAVLHLMGCRNRPFFIAYCNNVLYRAFVDLKKVSSREDVEDMAFMEETDIDLPLLDMELFDYEEYLSYDNSDEYDLGGEYVD